MDVDPPVLSLTAAVRTLVAAPPAELATVRELDEDSLAAIT